MESNSAKIPLILSILIFLLTGCDEMDVENVNDPDFETAYSAPDNIKALTGSLIHNWFITAHNYSGWALPLLAAADAGTSSWTYMYRSGMQPRTEYNNTPRFSDAYMNESYYSSLYANIAGACDVINLLEKNAQDFDDDTKAMMRAVAWFAHGISLGYIGLVYDRAFIVNNETNILQDIEVSSYKEIIAESVRSLERAIAISGSSTFTIPSEWLPGESWTSEEFAQLTASFAARLLVYGARNKSEDIETDWDRVYSLAASGLEKDFAPLADDIKWYSSYYTYANYSGFGQTDMYVVNMMDPSMPARWVDENTWDILPEPVTTHRDGVDDRIFTDFQYLSSCYFRPERGYYHFSCYRYKRMDQYLHTWVTPMPEFRKSENDYLLAEAALRTGRIREAADIINTSPRITRGALPPVPASPESIAAAIHHERMVELMCSGFGIQFFQMRKEDKLQPGSPLHYPIPGSQLEIMKMDYYTFGGTTGIPGTDYSTGGW